MLLIPYDENLPVYSSWLYYQSFQQQQKRACLLKAFQCRPTNMWSFPLLYYVDTSSLLGICSGELEGMSAESLLWPWKGTKTKAVIGCALSILLCDVLPRIATQQRETPTWNSFQTLMGENMEEWHAVLVVRLCLSREIRLQSVLTYALRTDAMCPEHLLCVVTCSFKVQLKNAVRILDIHLNIPLF